jgi:hypothetical protein
VPNVPSGATISTGFVSDSVAANAPIRGKRHLAPGKSELPTDGNSKMQRAIA